MALDNKKRKALISEIARIIVYDKSKLVVAMFKSNIQTVSDKTEDKVLADQVVENLALKGVFVENLATLITDINLSDLLEKKQLNSTGNTSESVGSSFGKQIKSSLMELATLISSNGANTKTLAKDELKTAITETLKEKEEEDKTDKWVARHKRLANIGITLTVVSFVALCIVGVYYYKKNDAE